MARSSGLRDLHHRLEGAGVLPVVARAQIEKIFKGHDLLVPEVVEPLHVVDEDLHELRALGADFQDLVELLVVVGEEEPGPAVVDDVLDLARRIRGVDPIGDPAHRQHAQVRVQPLRTIVRDDRHHVRRPQSERHQPKPHAPGPLAVLPPTDRAPYPQVLLAHRHLVAPLRHDMAKQLRQGILPQHGAGDAGVRRVRPRLHNMHYGTHLKLLLTGCQPGVAVRQPAAAGRTAGGALPGTVASARCRSAEPHSRGPLREEEAGSESACSGESAPRGPAGRRAPRARAGRRYRQVFLRFHRRVPRTLASFMPR